MSLKSFQHDVGSSSAQLRVITNGIPPRAVNTHARERATYQVLAGRMVLRQSAWRYLRPIGEGFAFAERRPVSILPSRGREGIRLMTIMRITRAAAILATTRPTARSTRETRLRRDRSRERRVFVSRLGAQVNSVLPQPRQNLAVSRLLSQRDRIATRAPNPRRGIHGISSFSHPTSSLQAPRIPEDPDPLPVRRSRTIKITPAPFQKYRFARRFARSVEMIAPSDDTPRIIPRDSILGPIASRVA